MARIHPAWNQWRKQLALDCVCKLSGWHFPWGCRRLARRMQKYRNAFFALVVVSCVRAGAIDLTNTWSLRAGLQNSSSPALSPDGVLYFGSGDHRLYAVSTNQYVKWSFATGLDIKSSPAIADDGTIYIGSRDRKFYAVTAEGKLKWSFATEGWVDSSPGIAPDGTVYFGSWDKNFYALKPNGEKKWAFATGGPIDSSPAIATDGTVYFGSHDKRLYALKPDGSKKWDFPTQGPVTSSPAIDPSGKIYFSSVDGNFYVLNPDGSLSWSTRTGGVTESSPVIAADGMIYICINESRAAISPVERHMKWIQRESWGWLSSTPTLGADGRIFYSGWSESISAFDPGNTTGWFFNENTLTYASPLIAPNGLLYAVTSLGPINALEVNTTLMNSAWPMFRANLRHTGVVNTPSR